MACPHPRLVSVDSRNMLGSWQSPSKATGENATSSAFKEPNCAEASKGSEVTDL